MGRVLQFDRFQVKKFLRRRSNPRYPLDERVYITSDGVYICHDDGVVDRFNGSVADLISIMVYHEPMDINDVKFYVSETCDYCPSDSNQESN